MNTFIERMWIMMLVMILGFVVQATYGKLRLEGNCPDEFIGVVSKVFNPGPYQGAYEKIEVHFNIVERIRGDLQDDVVLKVLKHGPYKFIGGETYKVSMNKGYLCSIDPMISNH